MTEEKVHNQSWQEHDSHDDKHRKWHEHDEKLYIAAIFLLAIALYVAFLQSTISEPGYKELIKLGISPANVGYIKISMPLLSFLSALAIFKAGRVQSAKATHSNPAHQHQGHDDYTANFIVAVLLLLAPIVSYNIEYSYSIVTALAVFAFSLAFFAFYNFKSALRYAAIIFALAGAYLAYSNLDHGFSLAKIREVGLVLPLSALALPLLLKESIDLSLIFFFVGLVLAPWLPALSLPILAFSAIRSVTEFRSAKFEDIIYWSVLVLFLIFYIFLNPAKENLVQAASIAVAIAMLCYFVIPLFNLSKLQNVFAIMLIAMGFANAMIDSEQKIAFGLGSVDEKHVTMFREVASLDAKGAGAIGEIAVIDYQYAFEYYTGKKPVMLTEDELLGNKSLGIDYAIISSDGLERLLQSRPIIFRLINIVAYQNGYQAETVTRNYAIVVTLDANYSIMSDGLLYDLNQGTQPRTVSFPKLKTFDANFKISDGSDLINTENILDTNLYNLLFKKTAIKEELGIKLVKVNDSGLKP